VSDEKRKTERHKVRFHLVYDDGSSFNAGTVHDVSEGGMFLETALPLDVGTEVRLNPLDNAGDSLFEVRARVIRSVPYDRAAEQSIVSGMGLQFLDLSGEDRARLVGLIRSLEDQLSRTPAGQVDPYLGVRVPAMKPPSGAAS
jgi:c-di-GMP-binding flagellar brake protein YcgR